MGYLSIQQVAEELSISPKTVRGLVRRGELPAYRFARRKLVIAQKELEKFKKDHRVVPRDETEEEEAD